MGGGLMGQGSGTGKNTSTANNTGAPAWSSGANGLGAAMNSFTPPAGSATAAGPGGYSGSLPTPPANFQAWQQQYQQGGGGAPQGGGAMMGFNPSTGSYVNGVGSAPGAQPPAATGNTGAAAPQSNVGPQPGTDAYNNLNTQLTTSPMQALTNLMQSGGMNQQTSQAIQNLMGTTGSNAAMDKAGQMFQNLGQGGTQNFQNVYGAAGQPGANQQYLQNYASGGEMMNNPYLDAIANRNKQDAAANVNQMYAAGGRYGSGYNQDAMANAVGNINNQLYGQEYENAANRQLTAANQMSQEQLGRLGVQNTAAQGVGGLQTAAAQGLGSLGNSSMQNYLTAQQNAGQLGTQGTQNLIAGMGQLGNVQNNKLFDTMQQLGVGNQTTGQTQQMLSNLAQQFTQGDMSDWARTGALGTMGTQMAGNWGTTTGQQSQTSQAGLGSILGGILGML